MASSSHKMTISGLDILAKYSHEFTSVRCEEIIESLVDGHWLEKEYFHLMFRLTAMCSSAGRIQIGVRSIAELEDFLNAEGLFPSCNICKTLVTECVMMFMQ